MADLIEEFVRQYERELDFYASAATLVQQHLEAALRSSGIKAIVTARAKRPESVETKLRKRALGGTAFGDFAAIRDELVDLAGVRVALYFPGQRAQVNDIIEGSFPAASAAKEHPDAPHAPTAAMDGAPYKKRFSGYSATHHRVHLFETQVPDDEKRLMTAVVEVQVASVLMHAWAEVEHDLIYKPLSGMLSTDEHSILDEINGLVVAGEIALAGLQRARDRRLAATAGAFESQYDLASFLHDDVRSHFGIGASQEAMGRADWLFTLLQRTGLNSREKLTPFLEALKPEFERRTIAEQVVDQILSADPDRYELFEGIRAGTPGADLGPGHESLGRFVRFWIILEKCLERISRAVPTERRRPNPIVVVDDLARTGSITEAARTRFHHLRRLRNDLLHGGRDAFPALAEEGTVGVIDVLKALGESSDPAVSGPAQESLAHLQAHGPA